MKNKIFSILLSISSLVSASMIHRSLEYIDKPASMAAVRKSLGTSPETAEERIIARTGGISNLDLPRVANEYWRYFVKGEGDFIDLINDETRQNGYKPLGLVADDIEYIETFIRKSFLGRSLQGERVPVESFELPSPELPKFLENEYEHTTYDIIESVLDSDDYSYLGPKEIRVDVADYLFQKHNKENKDNPGKKYLFSLKNSTNNHENKFKNEIRTFLNSLENKIEYFVKDLKINSEVLYLVVRSNDVVNKNDDLDVILKSDNINPELKLIIRFDDQNFAIPDGFKVLNSIKNVVFIGRNIAGIKNCFLYHCTNLQSIDLSALSNVMYIGDSFLCSLKKLRNIDLSPLSNVTYIGKNFLVYCDQLESIDLTPLSKVFIVDDYFLYDCDNLQSIKMTKKFKALFREDFFDQFPKLKKENIIIVD